jgi:hypothetical protein
MWTKEDRRRAASLLELVFYSIIFLGYNFHIFLTQTPWVAALTDWTFLTLAAGYFFVVFFFVLTGVSPIVSVVSLTQDLTNRVRRVSFSGLSISLDRNLGEVASVEARKTPDEVDLSFRIYLRRSQDSVDVAKRRPNALLFVGTFIAFLGLVFFILTLPGSHYGFLEATLASPQGDLTSATMHLLPRLLMLAFIQVLAGFFLRQYRSAMEDFRYYEAILRHREAQYLSYRLRKQNGSTNSLAKFADELLKEQMVGLLAKGQTTSLLEAQRSETNEFSSLLERLASLVGRGERREDQQDPSPSAGKRRTTKTT